MINPPNHNPAPAGPQEYIMKKFMAIVVILLLVTGCVEAVLGLPTCQTITYDAVYVTLNYGETDAQEIVNRLGNPVMYKQSAPKEGIMMDHLYYDTRGTTIMYIVTHTSNTGLQMTTKFCHTCPERYFAVNFINGKFFTLNSERALQ